MLNRRSKKVKYKAVNQKTDRRLGVVDEGMCENLPDMKALKFKRIELEKGNGGNS